MRLRCSTVKSGPEKIFLALLAAALPIVAGCAVTPRERVAAALDADGEVYFVSTSAQLIREVSEWFDGLERRVAESDSPRRDDVQTYLTSLRLLCRFVGAGNIEAVGASSRREADGSYIERFTAAGKPGSSWPKDLGNGPESHLPELRGLPADALSAVGFSINAEAVIGELRASGAEDLLENKKPILLGFSIREALVNTSGKWQAAILPPASGIVKPDDWSRCGFYLSCPDRGGVLFGRLSSLLPGDGSGVIRLSGGGDDAMFIAGGAERIRFYSSADCLARITSPKHTLGETPLFGAAEKKLPAAVSGAFYAANSGFGVWRFHPGMFEISACSPGGAALQTLRRLILTPLSAAVDQTLARPPTPQKRTASANRAEAPAPEAMKKRRDMLADAGKYLEGRSKTADRFPELPERYAALVCFGTPGWGSAKMPLVAETPDPERAVIGVLFVDGTIEFFDFTAPSLKHLCSFLHTRYHYDEKEFIRLIRRASELDEKQKGAAHGRPSATSH